MKKVLLTIAFAFAGVLPSFAQAQIIPLTIDPAQSSVEISIGSQNSSSQISGTATFDIQATNPPSGSAQLTSLDLTLDEGLDFSFGFFIFTVRASSDPGDVSLTMEAPGTAGTIAGGTFDQLGNTLALTGELEVDDPFNVAGGDQTFDLTEIDLGPVDFDSLTVTQSGDIITISGSVIINETIDIGGEMPLVVDLDLVATGEVPDVVILGDVNQDGFVNFLDISPFIAILAGGGFQVDADIDQSGEVNFLDIAPFILILNN